MRATETLEEVLAEWPAAEVRAMSEWVERIRAAHAAEVAGLRDEVSRLKIEADRLRDDIEDARLQARDDTSRAEGC